MHAINYTNRIFTAIANSESGEVSAKTLFRYFQEGDIVWAEYAGGDICKGFLVGRVLDDNRLEFTYQHINTAKESRIGKCCTVPELLPDGRLRLYETWQWLDGEQQCGTSMLEEVAAKA